ncbi:[FeFe] hydrogenase H-cluster maturation GTPase HydF [Gottschalkiaceae bacterium SANA]|nr:[FeFe] hydrogenase H-cluster maturation GTPase HydF [Gottschalkiaceae bacterium SANA]
MQQTPKANRDHIAIFGKRNSGKSSLMNAIIGQKISLVSAVLGTTTDPVEKTMELLPHGPVVFIDTAGIDDEGLLGDLRVKRSLKILQKTDFALYVTDATDPDWQAFEEVQKRFQQYQIPHLLVINKIDLLKENQRQSLLEQYPSAQLVSTEEEVGILELKTALIKKLQTEQKEKPILGDLLPASSTVLLIVPVDSEAPKGRLILPQVQVIRDCLDHGIRCLVCRDTELKQTLRDHPKIDLAVTDSQAFHFVSETLSDQIPLTGFSTLFARHKGDLSLFVEGIKFLDQLNEHSRILIAESCTHNHSHEDIGRVKIPKLLQKKTGKDLQFTFTMGHDFPEDLADYDFVIHCGSCMLNEKTMRSRLNQCRALELPITNYGILLAALNGILSQSLEIFPMIEST